VTGSNKKPSGQGQAPEVSFVIPAHGNLPFLARTLRSIVEQTSTCKLEIIVVNERAVGRLPSMVDGVRIKTVKATRHGAAAARNVGLAAARGRYVAFVDSDVVLDKLWTRVILENLAKPWIDCVQTPILPVGDETDFMSRFRFQYISSKTNGTFCYLSRAESDLPSLNSAAFAVRKSFLDGHGLRFDEDLDRCEDLDFGVRMIYAGCNFAMSTKSRAWVYDSRSPWGYAVRCFWTGYYTSRALGKWGTLPSTSLLVTLKRAVELKALDPMDLYISGVKLATAAGLLRGHWEKMRHPKPRAAELKLVPANRNRFLLQFNWDGTSHHLSPFTRIVSLDDKMVLLNLKASSRLSVSKEESVEFHRLLAGGSTTSASTQLKEKLVQLGFVDHWSSTSEKKRKRKWFDKAEHSLRRGMSTVAPRV
jgi:glycosyltransferase involved in cell wall biosynthesis